MVCERPGCVRDRTFPIRSSCSMSGRTRNGFSLIPGDLEISQGELE